MHLQSRTETRIREKPLEGSGFFDRIARYLSLLPTAPKVLGQLTIDPGAKLIPKPEGIGKHKVADHRDCLTPFFERMARIDLNSLSLHPLITRLARA
jgi:hypothetical protein